jgi:hypothetical protein
LHIEQKNWFLNFSFEDEMAVPVSGLSCGCDLLRNRSKLPCRRTVMGGGDQPKFGQATQMTRLFASSLSMLQLRAREFAPVTPPAQ